VVSHIELFEYPVLSPLDFWFWGWVKSEVYKRKVDTLDELLARILDTAACIYKRDDQLRRTPRELPTAAAKCPEVDSGIFESLL